MGTFFFNISIFEKSDNVMYNGKPLKNNDFNEEVNNLAKNYYDSLDNDGCKRIVYKQTSDKNRYYGDSSCLTYLKKEIRNSIMPKNIKDIDMVNAHPVILNYLCKKIMLIVIF